MFIAWCLIGFSVTAIAAFLAYFLWAWDILHIDLLDLLSRESEDRDNLISQKYLEAIHLWKIRLIRSMMQRTHISPSCQEGKAALEEAHKIILDSATEIEYDLHARKVTFSRVQEISCKNITGSEENEIVVSDVAIEILTDLRHLMRASWLWRK